MKVSEERNFDAGFYSKVPIKSGCVSRVRGCCGCRTKWGVARVRLKRDVCEWAEWMGRLDGCLIERNGFCLILGLSLCAGAAPIQGIGYAKSLKLLVL